MRVGLGTGQKIFPTGFIPSLIAMQEPIDNLSDGAKIVHDSLIDHPHLTTPEAIATGPYGPQQLSAGGVADALRELEAGGRAAESFAGWSVVD